MDRTLRQARLQQKLRQLKHRHGHRNAQQILEQLGIGGDRVTWFLPDDQSANTCVEWLNHAFPWHYSQIDWAKVPGSLCSPCQKDIQLVAVLDQLCQHFQLGNPDVTLIWFNAHNPLLHMELALVRHHAIALFNYDWDTWIIEPQTGWCIEYHHEGTLCGGYGAIAGAMTEQREQD